MKRQVALAALILSTAGAVALAQPSGHKSGPMGFKPTPERVIKYLDKDGDGLVSIDEFEMPDHGPRADIWRGLDADDDGAVSREEVQAHIDDRWMRFEEADINGDDLVTQDEVEAAIFAKLDADGDGFLTEDEFAEASESRRAERRAR